MKMGVLMLGSYMASLLDSLRPRREKMTRKGRVEKRFLSAHVGSFTMDVEKGGDYE